MRISSLTLQDFRNFAGTQTIEFPQAPLLVASAPNATGKTNFLEAIVVLLRGKSFRASHAECVRWGTDYFLLRGDIENGEDVASLAVQYQLSTKTLRIEEEGEPVSPVTFFSHYPLIMFLPDDTFMFYRGPALRRNFLNSILISSPQYLAAIVQYQRALKQRNAVLKSTRSQEDVQAWTQVVATHAALVWDYRQMAMDYLKGRVGKVYTTLFGEERKFELQFTPGSPNTKDYAKVLDDAWPHEQKYRYTLYGPHRDDIRIMVDGRSAEAVLSRGQMRSLVIALKVASQGFVESLTGHKPILLFDEVLSELDEERQRQLLSHLSGSQVLLTCTAIPRGLQKIEGMHQLDIQSLVQTLPPKKEEVPVATKKEVVIEDTEEEIVEEKDEVSEEFRVSS